MALDERARNVMYNRLREVMGHEVADTMMESLSPIGWRDFATKQDLVDLEARLVNTFESKFEVVENKLETLEYKVTAAFERGLRSQTRWFMLGNAGLVIAMTSYFSTVH